MTAQKPVMTQIHWAADITTADITMMRAMMAEDILTAEEDIEL